ncbi:UPF0764 protein C16orf89 homolog [Heteronotia binoei]|uniref:UPF0764 protein C16orf89 homolog n=1 Tax=Heteronotia binoei TaxID=13085 RepID=UPI0029303293|nr:UPF0764 protein C16orf89 homolog [Heteronotia binoei]
MGKAQMHFLVFQLAVSLLNPILSRSEEDMRSTILTALEKATLFLNDSYDEINLDAVMGYRMLQGYLDAVKKKWDSQPGLQLAQERVVRLEEQLSTLIDKAEQAVEQKTPGYYRWFAPALGLGFWKIPHRWTQTDPSLAPSLTNGTGCLSGNRSDSCISHLLGTWGDGAEPCSVPNYCPDVMTRLDCSGYSLSHQLLYFMFADAKECSNPLFLDAPYYKEVFCASMKQMNVEGEKEARLYTFGDLFVENILLCGMSGFSDFFKPQWLRIILNWQKPEKGCFWMYGDQFQSSSQNSKEPSQGLKRVKRQEKILKDGCASHNTGVAVAALGGFLHYGF